MARSRVSAHTAFACSARAPRCWTWAAGVVSACLGLVLARWAWPFFVDDAFIVARYAQRIAHGEGYSFQAGPAVDGVTGPLWLVPLVASERLGFELVGAAKVLGILASLASLAIVFRRSSARWGGRARAVWLALFLASSAPMWIWSIGGLETSAAALLTTLMVLSAAARPKPNSLGVGLSGGALIWLRPELAFLVSFSLALSALRARRAGLRAAALVLGSGLMLVAFRQMCFEHFLPLSAHAKPASLVHGAGYLLESLRAPGTLALLPFLGLCLRYGRRDDRIILLALVVHATAVLLAGGDWMAGSRLWVPLVPLACLSAAVGASELMRRRPSWALVLALVTGVVRVPAAFAEATSARASGQLRERRVPELLRALAKHPDPVAILDIGAVGYLGGHKVIDLGGLVEPDVAYAPGGHLAKRIEARWLVQRAPFTLVLHSRVPPRVDREGRLRWFAGYPVERWVLGQRWVQERFRVSDVVPYAADYYYVVLTARETPQ